MSHRKNVSNPRMKKSAIYGPIKPPLTKKKLTFKSANVSIAPKLGNTKKTQNQMMLQQKY
jgi:hypothetical protein